MWTASSWRQLKELTTPPLAHFTALMTLTFFAFAILLTNWYFLIIAIFIPVLTKIRPAWFNPLNRGWHNVGLLLAWIFQPVVLTVFYFCLLGPFALLFKFFKKNSGDGQWIEKKSSCRFEKPF